MVFLFNRFRRGYRYSRKLVPAWIPIFQEFGPAWTPIFQEIGSNVDADIPGNRFQREYRFPRNSVPAWIPIFQEIGSNVDADIPGNRLQRGRRYSRDIGSGVNTESQRFEWASEDRKTKIRRVDFRRIDEPRFVSASRWIYRIRLSVLGFGYMEFGFRFLGLDIWVSTFGWALDIWISFGFDFWFLGFEYKDFGFRLLGVGYMGFVFRLLGVGYTGFDFQFSGFRYVGFDFRLGFGYMGKFPLRIFGWIFLWTSIEWVSLSYFVR
ncbi:unnamed protein product [Rhizophagus irregularis]|nr:unnamed protein product [Rhizophagus irregularis]